MQKETQKKTWYDLVVEEEEAMKDTRLNENDKEGEKDKGRKRTKADVDDEKKDVVVCWSCHQDGHKAWQCPKKRDKKCWECGKRGHIASACGRHRQKPKKEKKEQEKNSSKYNIAFM